MSNSQALNFRISSNCSGSDSDVSGLDSKWLQELDNRMENGEGLCDITNNSVPVSPVFPVGNYETDSETEYDGEQARNDGEESVRIDEENRTLSSGQGNYNSVQSSPSSLNVTSVHHSRRRHGAQKNTKKSSKKTSNACIYFRWVLLFLLLSAIILGVLESEKRIFSRGCTRSSSPSSPEEKKNGGNGVSDANIGGNSGGEISVGGSSVGSSASSSIAEENAGARVITRSIRKLAAKKQAAKKAAKEAAEVAAANAAEVAALAAKAAEAAAIAAEEAKKSKGLAGFRRQIKRGSRWIGQHKVECGVAAVAVGLTVLACQNPQHVAGLANHLKEFWNNLTTTQIQDLQEKIPEYAGHCAGRTPDEPLEGAWTTCRQWADNIMKEGAWTDKVEVQNWLDSVAKLANNSDVDFPRPADVTLAEYFNGGRFAMDLWGVKDSIRDSGVGNFVLGSRRVVNNRLPY